MHLSRAISGLLDANVHLVRCFRFPNLIEFGNRTYKQRWQSWQIILEEFQARLSSFVIHWITFLPWSEAISFSFSHPCAPVTLVVTSFQNPTPRNTILRSPRKNAQGFGSRLPIHESGDEVGICRTIFHFFNYNISSNRHPGKSLPKRKNSLEPVPQNVEPTIHTHITPHPSLAREYCLFYFFWFLIFLHSLVCMRPFPILNGILGFLLLCSPVPYFLECKPGQAGLPGNLDELDRWTFLGPSC